LPAVAEIPQVPSADSTGRVRLSGGGAIEALAAQAAFYDLIDNTSASTA